jgi:hypothetical protein
LLCSSTKQRIREREREREVIDIYTVVHFNMTKVYYKYQHQLPTTTSTICSRTTTVVVVARRSWNASIVCSLIMLLLSSSIQLTYAQGGGDSARTNVDSDVRQRMDRVVQQSLRYMQQQQNDNIDSNRTSTSLQLEDTPNDSLINVKPEIMDTNSNHQNATNITSIDNNTPVTETAITSSNITYRSSSRSNNNNKNTTVLTTTTVVRKKTTMNPICPIIECMDGYTLQYNSTLKISNTLVVPCENILYASMNGYITIENCHFLLELQCQQNTCQCSKVVVQRPISTKKPVTVTPTRRPSTSYSPTNVPSIQPTTLEPSSELMYPKCIICTNSIDDEKNMQLPNRFDNTIDVVTLPDNDKTTITCNDSILAGSIGFLSKPICIYLNKLMSEQGVCGCTSTTNPQNNSPSSSSSTTDTSTVPIPSSVPTKRTIITKIWDGRYSPSTTPTTVPTSNTDESISILNNDK